MYRNAQVTSAMFRNLMYLCHSHTGRDSRTVWSCYRGCCFDRNESEVIQAMMLILQSEADNSMLFELCVLSILVYNKQRS